MLEQRPTAVAPALLVLGLGCTLAAPWLPLSAPDRHLLTALAVVGAVLAAGPAWRFWVTGGASLLKR